MRKKLFAILMSAMMMVTFMPAMAFAAEGDVFVVDSWAADYSTATGHISGNATTKYTVSTKRYFHTNSEVSGNAGQISVKADISGYKALQGATNDDTAYYYDLNNFVLNGNDFGFATLDQDCFEGLFASGDATAPIAGLNNEFTAKAPEYVENYTATTKATGVSIVGYVATMARPAEYVSGSFETQTFTAIPVKVVKNGTAVNESSKDNGDVIGTVQAKSFTVSAVTPLAANAKFYVDTVKKTNEVTGNATFRYNFDASYDGAEHEVVMGPLPGATVTYQKMNDLTGKYEAVDKATYKDAGLHRFVAVVKIGTTDSAKFYINIAVDEATGIEVLWNEAMFDAVANCFYAPSDFNVADYFVVSANARAKKAVAADKAELLAYVGELYDVVKTVSPLDANKVTVSFQQKEDVDTTAVAKKYASLLKNYASNAFDDQLSTATFYISGGEIEWVKAPLNKTYKAKKGKLAKTKNFTIKATASAAVTYKMTGGAGMIKINKTTGKVTVKKGLKKGTYKVKVYANAGAYASDNYVLKIKVK